MRNAIRSAIRTQLTVLLVAAMESVLAQPAGDEQLALASTSSIQALDLNVSHGVRLSYEPITLSRFSGLAQPTVFTSMYWSRAHEEKAALAERFGLHWAYGLSVDPVGNAQYTGHSPLGYPENVHWTAKAVAGLQIERHDLLFTGDRLSLRSTSDVQALMREAGVFRSSEEVDMLSLLGWRSRSSLVWQMGEPTREIQWQFTAKLDRRAYSQASTANFSLLRRF
jgi:hypothetical protein